jgi:hypothetical protein
MKTVRKKLQSQERTPQRNRFGGPRHRLSVLHGDPLREWGGFPRVGHSGSTSGFSARARQPLFWTSFCLYIQGSQTIGRMNVFAIPAPSTDVRAKSKLVLWEQICYGKVKRSI